MGLSAPKKRRKITHDPNNISWTRDSTSYGHRILSSQGWSPGSTLGAADASHAPHYTAGSTSHIRVLLKDDNLGLGAKRGGKEREETFGLGQLADIYGRLNGKSDGALEKEQRARADLGAKLYVQQRFGALPFVRGGFLVGDRIEEKEPPAKAVEAPCDPMPTVPNMMHEDKTPKKRKRSKRDPADVVNDDLEKGARPKEGETKEERRHRKEDRRKAKAAHKAEKVARRAAREERRRHKQEKRRRKAEDTGKAETSPPSLAANVQSPASPAPTSGNSTPLTSNPFNNRNAVRQRFIRQKRMASMNTQALKEILMLKA